MFQPPAAKMTNAGSSARMFASTVATLGCAFLLLMAAGTGVIVAITRDANRLEAQRQTERIEAAFSAQIRLNELRLEGIIVTSDLPSTLLQDEPQAAVRAALTRMRGLMADFDGAYIASAAGVPLASFETPAQPAHGGHA